MFPTIEEYLDALIESIPYREDLLELFYLDSIVDGLLVLTPLLVLAYFIFYIKSERRKQAAPATHADHVEDNQVQNNAESRFNAIREHHDALRQRTHSSEQEDSVSIPKRLGKKKARNLEAKENLRRFREWQVSQEHEQQHRRDLLNEVKEKYDKEKEKLRKKEDAEQQRLKREEEKRKKEKQAQRKKQEDAKPLVIEREKEVLRYLQTNVVVNLETMASDLQLRAQELRKYIHQQLEYHVWMGQFDEQGKFIYIEPSRLHTLRAILEAQGFVSSKQAVDIFMGKEHVLP